MKKVRLEKKKNIQIQNINYKNILVIKKGGEYEKM